MSQETSPAEPRAFPWHSMIVWTVTLAVGTYLLTRHASHVLQFLPLVILFACPLMHLFHHRHHKH